MDLPRAAGARRGAGVAAYRISGQKKLVPMIGLALTANQLEAKS
jgi:hypothetical protein